MAAKNMGIKHLDTDQVIEQSQHAACAQIIRQHGQNHFRRIERQTLLSIISSEPTDTIVATGGGLPCHLDNMGLMNSAGTTVYLQWSPAQLVERIYLSGTSHRPLVAHLASHPEAMLDFVTRHLEQRQKYYRQAHITLNCDNLDDNQILDKFLEAIASNPQLL